VELKSIDAIIPLWHRILGSAMFSGYSPYAPGTIGSLVGLGIYFLPYFEESFIIIPCTFFITIFGARSA
jgi:phosphatidylglycerophosphatase A